LNSSDVKLLDNMQSTGKFIETAALAAKAKEREFMLDIPPSFTYHTPPVPQDSDVA